MQMNLNAIHYAYYFGVKKFIQLGTTCSFPKFASVPFKEEYLWYGFLPPLDVPYVDKITYSNYPEETNAPYGIAKRVLLTMLEAYKKEYNFNGVYLIPTNLYGEGDHFEEATSHVIPALIKKIFEARKEGKSEIICWGTGNASRDFIYAGDAADAIIMALENYNGEESINIGSGKEIKIKELVNLICSIMKYEGKIVWDTSKPDGQPRRCLDTTKAEKYLNFRAITSFEEGLKKTIDWYVKKVG
jgi:GDP-L-fucose synthase